MMDWIRGSVLFVAFSLCGCGAMEWATGIKRGEDGKITIDKDNSPADKAIGVVGTLGTAGIAVAGALGLVTRYIRHKQIVANGQKDENFDGVPDDQDAPKT